MLVLFETSAGYAIFKLFDKKKIKDVPNLFEEFQDNLNLDNILKLVHFEKFKDTNDALKSLLAINENKLTSSIKKALKTVYTDCTDKLALVDSKLGAKINEKYGISCVSNSKIQELHRCIRSQYSTLIGGLDLDQRDVMALGLAHSVSHYKLKFSPDKIDTMIVQAVSLLDDLDKEINNYAMRAREWYGWHFPELSNIISDNCVYAKLVKKMGNRNNSKTCKLEKYLVETDCEQVRKLAEISMGNDITDDDVDNITQLCEQIIDLSKYKVQLSDYLKNRMSIVAPNLTALVGELVGARLISHAGSLFALAKHPASTIQIFGAEKALFRALKHKHDTPKYGIIFHASYVGQVSSKLKGKISRKLAAKTSLAIRMDAFTEGENSVHKSTLENIVKIESGIKYLEHKQNRGAMASGRTSLNQKKIHNKTFTESNDIKPNSTIPVDKKKRKMKTTHGDEKKVKVE
ncbi:Nucleolar protein 58 [Intoshia linei]|uniref:Nucleolar protein 58 n=1 Tax=Intoshia linei TaxID=1819745 RepID=A0A177BC91_9BILA|nr:Nucleolar protein 58 [Intoshia linei]